MPPKKPYEPIDPNPVAHLMPSERFSPPARQDCREMTVTDPKTGEEVLMLKRGFGDMAVWKPAEEWKAENKAMWAKFYAEHPASPPPRDYGTYQGDFDGHGNYPPGSGSSYACLEQAAPQNPQPRKQRQYVEEPKSLIQIILETIFVLIALAMPIMALIIGLRGG